MKKESGTQLDSAQESSQKELYTTLNEIEIAEDEINLLHTPMAKLLALKMNLSPEDEDTPIRLTTIIDVCGIDGMMWVIEHEAVPPQISLAVNSLGAMINMIPRSPDDPEDVFEKKVRIMLNSECFQVDSFVWEQNFDGGEMEKES